MNTGPDNIAGIDIGSRSIELVALSPAGTILHQVRRPTTFDPLRQCRDILDGVAVEQITATGYGRKLFAESGIADACGVITDIQAYALGTAGLFSEARTVFSFAPARPLCMLSSFPPRRPVCGAFSRQQTVSTSFPDRFLRRFTKIPRHEKTAHIDHGCSRQSVTAHPGLHYALVSGIMRRERNASNSKT